MGLRCLAGECRETSRELFCAWFSLPDVAFIPLNGVLAEEGAHLILEVDGCVVILLVGDAGPERLDARRGG